MSNILDKLKIKHIPKQKSIVEIRLEKPKKTKKFTEKESLEKERIQQSELYETKNIDNTDVIENADAIDNIEDISIYPKSKITKIIDKTSIGFDREKLMERLKRKELVPPTIQGDKPMSIEKEPPIKIKKHRRKLKTIKEEEELLDETNIQPTLDIIDQQMIKDEPSKEVIKVKKIKGKKLKLSSKIQKGSITATVDEKPIAKKKYDTKKVLLEEPETMLKIIGDTTIEDRIIPREKKILAASSYFMENRKKYINFINTLFYPYRQEIVDDDKEVSCESRKSGSFEAMPHQKIVRDYLSIHSPYRGLLLYHGLGSGKTCSSIGIAEGLKNNKQIIIMTPASLRMNYIKELKNCGDIIYKKNQFWEFIHTSGEPSIIRTLSKILHLSIEFIKKQGGAWLINMKKTSNFLSLSNIEKQSLDNQLNEMIRAKYKFINYNGLRNTHLAQLTHNGEINPFDNKVIIIDEAHNFISRIVNKLKKPESLSMRLYNYLLSAKDARIVLLTGTPIINYPNEIGILYNILRGYIQTWHIPLTIKTDQRVNQETMNELFAKFGILDYIQYNAYSKQLLITRNPFGFINSIKRSGYNGVKFDERGSITDKQFIEFITKKLKANNIEPIISSIDIKYNKALPDNIDQFKNYFIQSRDGSMKNENLFKRRILGLTSYFRSAQEQLMPSFDIYKDYHVEKIYMTDYQFGVYETARQSERKEEESQKKRKRLQKAQNIADLYDEPVSTYRIFSRLFCNFVFPPSYKRPMPKDGEELDDIMKMNADEDDIDGAHVTDKLQNVDGRYSMDDEEQLSQREDVIIDDSYEARIESALTFLKNNKDEYLVRDKLEKYSPKYLSILNNITNKLSVEGDDGLHLIYSQFRKLEGIGIFKLVLESNGFAQFKISKLSNGNWMVDLDEKDYGKPMFALYTGTEDAEEKEIIRNIFNSDWESVPSTITEVLREQSSNNHYGQIIKVLMITASGAEGIDLKNIRYVHLMESYWHPVRLEQVIGRAVRICSHQALPESLRNVQVYLYLMTFTEKQIISDESIELRVKDVSRIDDITPLTSDEALDEISRIKQSINKQILTAVKESSMDCAIHSRDIKGENLVCFSFGDTDNNDFSFTPYLMNEEKDVQQKKNVKTISWQAITVKIGTHKFKLRLDNRGKRTDKIYDYDSFNQALKNPAIKPIYIGKLLIRNGKVRIIKE